MLPAGARQLENRYRFESCFAPAFCVFGLVVTGCVSGRVAEMRQSLGKVVSEGRDDRPGVGIGENEA